MKEAVKQKQFAMVPEIVSKNLYQVHVFKKIIILKKLILAIGILISCYTVTRAQYKKYMVTFENDTIYGNVKRKMDCGYVKYNFKAEIKTA